jgi:exodeoxyribonuclease VII large subunit
MPLPKPTPVSVTELNRKAKSLLENQLGEVCVEAEIGDLSQPSSGHWYFTLKDGRSQLRCAMFRRANTRVGFQPKVGDSVLVRGLLSIYEARGDYQLIVDTMEASGDGALQHALEALKKKLFDEGLFEASRKRPIPAHCERIGIITSPTGAAVEDIASVLARRSPLSHLFLFPVQVQGAAAAQQIADAIAHANEYAESGERDLDVLIVGRGGGSLEDLWSFNEEVVARAIASSRIPIVSAVGHEIDYSISDLVADLRAATPSQAGELITRDSLEWLQIIDNQTDRLQLLSQRKIREQTALFLQLKTRLRHPRQQFSTLANELQRVRDRAGHLIKQRLTVDRQLLAKRQLQLSGASPSARIKLKKELAKTLAARLPGQIDKVRQRNEERVRHLTQLLTTLGPEATLKRGYAIVTDHQGTVLRQSESVAIGQGLSIKLSRGRITSTVATIEALENS